jgi:hypothetical protein
MDIQQEFETRKETESRKKKVEGFIAEIKDGLFDKLPSDLQGELKIPCLKILSDESKFLDNQITDITFTIQSCIAEDELEELRQTNPELYAQNIK